MLVFEREGLRALLQKTRVLVVEDEKTARETYAKILERDGYFVETARDLETAVSRLAGRAYHVALVDIMLNGPDDTSNRDGLKILELIKREHLATTIGKKARVLGPRAIALTGQDDPELAAHMVQDLGAFGYMDKSKYGAQIRDELLGRVQKQAQEARLSLFGRHRNAVSFLAGEGNESLWVDRALRALSMSRGFQGLQRILSECCDPFAPLEAELGTPVPARVDSDAQLVFGTFWSKALATSIYLQVGPEQKLPQPVRSIAPNGLGPSSLLAHTANYGVSAAVFEVSDATRSQFTATTASDT